MQFYMKCSTQDIAFQKCYLFEGNKLLIYLSFIYIVFYKYFILFSVNNRISAHRFIVSFSILLWLIHSFVFQVYDLTTKVIFYRVLVSLPVSFCLLSSALFVVTALFPLHCFIFSENHFQFLFIVLHLTSVSNNVSCKQ